MNEQILAFLRELRSHNDRGWFQANKGRYNALHQAFLDEVQALIDRISFFDPDVAGMEAKDCVFRIYRDIRFSADKTPYKQHFGAFIALGGRCSERGGYYFHLEPDGCMLSGGIWCPSPALLKRLRQDIYDQMEEFTSILDDPAFKQVYPELEGETLKRVPAGYPQDSPYGHILKHKYFCVSTHKPDSFFSLPDWMDRVVDDFKLLFPFNHFLNYTVDEYQGRI